MTLYQLSDVHGRELNVGDFVLSQQSELDYAFFDLDHEAYYLDSVHQYNGQYLPILLEIIAIHYNESKEITSFSLKKMGREYWLRTVHYVPRLTYADFQAKNLSECVKLYKDYLFKRSQQGDLDALTLLAIYVGQGGTALNQENLDQQILSKSYFEQASQAGGAYASYQLSEKYRMTLSEVGMKVYAEDRENNHRKYLSLAAAQGNRSAQCHLAFYYQYGKQGFEENLEKAFYWYQCSAEQNDPYAACNVADFYYAGWVVVQNFVKAEYFYKQAAAWRIPKAFRRLAELHLHQQVENIDITQAMYNLKQAIKYGDSEAKKILRHYK